ncbi:MAG: flavin reductase family protein [Desulfovibrionaceae bacterium]|jgi:flavin reductase (DIM6/NTAB) family NADH-FMN oxidoreductase RutF|nr:flavin reductase family protein [Desulfovibrionaceae bacterium]
MSSEHAVNTDTGAGPDKVRLGPVNALYPSLTTLVGAVVDGRPNFLAVAHVGIMNHGTPQYVSVGLNKAHHTPRGITAHGEFSICLPGRDLVEKTDYAGLVSGRRTDKSRLFDVFFGDLAHAPLIRECPVCMECRLARVLDFETHDVFVGEIVQTHADRDVLDAGGAIDVRAVDPLLFDMASRTYWALGEPAGKCWSAGKAMKERLEP